MALVTGGARRLGAATVRALHAAGFDLAIHFHSSALAARELAAELNEIRSSSAFTLRQDLAARRAGNRLVAAIEQRRARLDLLVNNASVFDSNALAVDDFATWDRIQGINLRTPYYLAVAAAPLLRRTRGSIVNIVDIHAERPRAGYAIYCASKAGLLAVTRSLALELAPEIRVNAVSPGAILWAESEAPAMRAAALRAVPLERRGEPADIAAAVCYLATASYVTGHVINVDGGRLLSG
ncbi:MAG: pteridine reductase [Gammaproteobacteria bacterium]